jgi:hypothetical protein
MSPDHRRFLRRGSGNFNVSLDSWIRDEDKWPLAVTAVSLEMIEGKEVEKRKKSLLMLLEG